MSVTETKPWWQSLTQWGAILTTLCSLLLPIIGQADLAQVVVAGQVDISNALAAVGTAIGLIMVVVGRFKATKGVTIT
jgi:hypothetical protein